MTRVQGDKTHEVQEMTGSNRDTLHPRTVELLAHLDRSRTILQEAVDAIPPEKREVRPGSDQWSVAEILEHLSLVEGRITQLLDSHLAGGALGGELNRTPILRPEEIARVVARGRRVEAAESGRPRQGLTSAAAWKTLAATRAAFDRAVVASSGLALGNAVFPHRVLGLLNLYQWIVFVGSHEQRHAAQIRESYAR